MVYSFRTAAQFALLLLLASGCRPFQQSATAPFESSPAEVKQVANRAAPKLTNQTQPAPAPSRELANQAAAPAGNTSGSQANLGDSDPSADATCHSESGYCSSCGVTHGGNLKANPFKFSEPLPPYQPLARPQSAQPQSQTSSAPSLPQTHSSAVRVRPLQPEEARSAVLAQNQSAAARQGNGKKAPPPEPDDSPATPDKITTAITTTAVAVNDQATLNPAVIAATETNLDMTLSATTAAADSALSKAPAVDPALTTGAKSETTLAEPLSDTEASADLAQTIGTLRQRLNESDASEMNESLTAGLTALELLAVRVQDLAQGSSQPSDAQALCRHQLEALVATLRPDALDISRPEGRQIAATTLEHLREAIAELEKLVSLKVTAGALCSEVRGFGQYKPFAVNQFRTGQPVLLYCEIENFCSTEEKNPNGNSDYRTRLKSSLVICKADGTVAQQAEFPVVEDIARNRRRDFYLYVPFTVGELTPGEYRIHLMVDDQQGHKQAVLEPPVTFTVQ